MAPPRTTALSPQERDVVARREAGQSATRIAVELGLKRDAVYAVLARARRKGVIPRPHPALERTSRAGQDCRPRAAAQARPCIRCREPFLSEGPHNRMCGHCRGFAAGMAPQFIGA